MSDEDWVKSAITDDSIVVELLMRLHQAPPKAAKNTNLSPTFPLHWSVRQRRSRPSLKSTPTSSPTTPLSWSGGATSVSGGFEESSQPPPPNRPDAPRSKVNATYGTSTSKRTKRRKNLVELKEEETLLLKERKNLKREIAALRINLLEQRAANERLKRLKVESESQFSAEALAPPTSFEATPEKLNQEPVTCDFIPLATQPDVKTDVHEVAAPSKPQNVPSNEEDDKFVLPDLNLSIDDFNSSAALDQIS